MFAEITFHAAYEPQRAVRTRRYKYIRRFDNGHDGPVLANIDDSPSKDLLVMEGTADPPLSGAIEPARGTELNLPAGRSPADPTILVART